MVNLYVFLLGIFLAGLGSIELTFPVKSFEIWMKWINHKLFPIHGLLLILVGFPLTIYKYSMSGIIFVIGLIYVISGPFILLFPEKFKSIFVSLPDELGPNGVKRMIRFDAIIRIAIGILLVSACRASS